MPGLVAGAYAGKEPDVVGNRFVGEWMPVLWPGRIVCGPLGAPINNGGLALRTQSLLFLLALWLDCVLLHLPDGLLDIHPEERDHERYPG